jgi:hypothetical protein
MDTTRDRHAISTVIAELVDLQGHTRLVPAAHEHPARRSPHRAECAGRLLDLVAVPGTGQSVAYDSDIWQWHHHIECRQIPYGSSLPVRQS